MGRGHYRICAHVDIGEQSALPAGEVDQDRLAGTALPLMLRQAQHEGFASLQQRPFILSLSKDEGEAPSLKIKL
jgi:hypothetical protein